MVHTTRFNSMSAMFVYPDGSTDIQTVHQGSYRDHWHTGGQIAFSARVGIPVAAAWMRIDNLGNYDLLRVRFLPGETAARQFELSALAIGAALALLAMAAAYNIGLALVLRRRFFLWHGFWAAAVLVWGIVWSQAGLVFFPETAGTVSSRLATILACLAIMFAAFSTAAALRSALPETARRSVIGLGLLVAALGIFASVPGADLAVYGILLSIGTLMTLAAVAISIGITWWRGYAEGRDMAISWAFPMIVLAMTQLVDFDTFLWGGGAQIVVLFASAFQALCLSSLATARLSALRVQRDAAVAAGNTLAELADRDPLTGLLNRRGFVSRCEQAFGEHKTSPFGLLLIDVDHFKRVNDRFGHEAGDAVLVALGTKLQSFEQRYPCLAGRLGGEEFVLGVAGLSHHALGQLAEAVRQQLGTCDQSTGTPLPSVTVSIGVAEGVADGPFRKLYGRADRALYTAKHAGRNTVVFASDIVEASDAQISFLDPEDQEDGTVQWHGRTGVLR
ncbi:sensor domain-containing diguanylate cyclase [Altericroceibacterium xinjiangense]|uniref:sensor domain-containing diguanylate cyclase n=1 Tax=Altericroceibacterium xinjiangense TaxID=762261 RepID=UPI0019D1130D|nr:diguanylate cyclase [Altericroceibacterium xinjiangense]